MPDTVSGYATGRESLFWHLERVDAGVLSVDETWRITLLTSSATRLVDEAVDDPVGRELWDVSSAAETVESALRLTMQGREPISVPVADSPFDAALDAVPDPDGGISVFLRDESDTERELRQTKQSVTRAVQELRDPLRVATGRLELARRTTDSDHLDAVRDAHDRLAAQLCDLSTLVSQQ